MAHEIRPGEPSALVRFYLGEGTDAEGRSLREIRGWSDRRLEAVHDYVQWLFPTRQRSRFNPAAPEVNAEDVRAFREDAALRTELVASLRQMLDFYGFSYAETDGGPVIGKGDEWAARSGHWFRPGNHNLLRITRMLDCLSTLGLGEQARALLAALEGACAESPGAAGSKTLEFWRAATKQAES